MSRLFPKGPTASAALPDSQERELIVSLLDRNIMVEAAAGTGKTTAMIGRMLALVRSGACSHIRHMAAITFTRKAASEIRSRFRSSLEEAHREAQGMERENLERALENAEQCFIGTIHSFCARILRERPLEAGIGFSFREMDDLEDSRLREEAWELFCARLFFDDPSDLLRRLREMGLRLSDLEKQFQRFADFPDVEEWPIPGSPPEDHLFDTARRELEDYVHHIAELAPRLPSEPGNDKLIPHLRRAARVVSHLHLDRTAELMEAVEFFDRSASVVLSVWDKGYGLGREEAREEERRWNRFRREVVQPALTRWREMRYALCLEVLRSAMETYDHLRHERGLLNFQDLLLSAARLLRENTEVRKDLQSRYTHLLVDEFQDTDPVQAETIFLLASSDPAERDWRRCVPRPGSLFLVGDPKQSIYRFRRADISIYNEVKDILQKHGGVVLNLTGNFRSPPEIVEWVNEVFSPEGHSDAPSPDALRFPAEADEFSPAYVGLVPSFTMRADEGFHGVYRLTVPAACSRNEQALAYMADRIARFIRDACSGGLILHRSPGGDDQGKTEVANPSDFLILTFRKDDLAIFAERLHDNGIPCRTSGGQSLNRVPELQLLHQCLKAVLRPYDPVALVALLRSELFGISDVELYAFKKAGGVFDYRERPPSDLKTETGQSIADAFRRLKEYRQWFLTMPLLTALERMVHDLGLMLSAALRPGGEMQAGSLAKALEILRDVDEEILTCSQLLEHLERLVDNHESYDGISALSEDPPAVRVMNLHRAKGLEAPVVFLAGVSGFGNRDPEIHVARTPRGNRGYLAIQRETSPYTRIPLAHPSDWETVSQRERLFLEAEYLRLMYVAATRASSACVVSVKERNDSNHPWRFFLPHLKNAPELPEFTPSAAGGEIPVEPDFRAFEDWVNEKNSRAQAVLRPSYKVVAAKRLALASLEGEEPHTDPDAEDDLEVIPISPIGKHGRKVDDGRDAAPCSSKHSETGSGAAASDAISPEQGEAAEVVKGPDFGEVVHLLLQAAMEDPSARLEALAVPLLEERDLDPGLAVESVDLVRKAMQTTLWERAKAASRCLTEVPFHILANHTEGIPTIVRGVVDLAFREEDGWVLVDYKTYRGGMGDPTDQAAKHLPQLRLYADVWERALGEPVKEVLVHLLGVNRLFGSRRSGGGRWSENFLAYD